MEAKSRKFLLIRHAESEFNFQRTNSIDRTYPIYDKELIDCEITKNGQIQSNAANKKAKNFPISIVFVSPLKRALQTAQLIFKNHPNNPKICVIPYLRERVSASCDLSNFNNEKPLEGFEDFDWTHMIKCYEGKLGNIDKMKEFTRKDNINEEKYEILNFIKESIFENKNGNKKEKLETVQEFRKSIEKFVNFLNYIKTDYKLEDQEYIAIVSHFGTLKYLVENVVKDKENQIIYFENCEIKEFNF